MVAGPLARLLAQLTVMGASIVSRAFLQAYQQAAANAKAGGGQTAQQARRALRKQITSDESLKILNFESRPQTVEEVIKQYEKFFLANDPKKGGSFYLQSKFYRAKECLVNEINAEKGKSAEK